MPYFPSMSNLFFVFISNQYGNSMPHTANICQLSAVFARNAFCSIHGASKESRQINGTSCVYAICIPAQGKWHDFCFMSSSFSMGVGFPAVLPCINQLIFATNLS
jgi:hypothetical protein